MVKKSNKNKTFSIEEEQEARRNRINTKKEIKKKIRSFNSTIEVIATLAAIVILLGLAYFYYLDKRDEAETKKALKDYCIELCYENEKDFDICKWRCRNADD